MYAIRSYYDQGKIPTSKFKNTGLPAELNSTKGIMQNGKINFMKSGLMNADLINTVSNTYANEIRTNT